MSFVFRSMSAEIREWAEEVLAIQLSVPMLISLATVIHSLSCPFSSSKPSFLRVRICRMVWSGGLPTGLAVVHRMRQVFGDWLFHCTEFGEPSASSRFHQRVHRGWVCNHSSNVFIRDPFLCYIPHRQPAHLAETSMVESFQFGPVLLLSVPSFRFPRVLYSQQSLDRACDGYRYLLLPSNCLFMEPNSFLAWLIRSVMSAVSLSSGTGKILSIWTWCKRT
jgi:hypothetical protein